MEDLPEVDENVLNYDVKQGPKCEMCGGTEWFEMPHKFVCTTCGNEEKKRED